MGIKALCAAAAVVVAGVGAVDAAVVRKDVTFTFSEAVRWEEGDLHDRTDDVFTYFDHHLGLPVGSPIKGELTITDIADAWGEDLRWVNLVVGGVKLFADEVAFTGPRHAFFNDTRTGWDWYRLELFDALGFYEYFDDDRPNAYTATGTFSIAPVPLPASAALLPLCFGALALLRKRRRSAA